MGGRAKALWRQCLASALRSALACTIVGMITLYGPSSIQRLIAFPAFSYATVILIINDATLGDTLRGCWLALYATIQSIGPAILSLWLIGPRRFTTATTALAVALASFVVALPVESTHMIAKRIALGEIVLVYVVAYANGARTEPLMHPLRLAASVAIGVLASVLALLIPFPRLASHQVKQNNKLLAQNTLERLKLLVKAICEEDKTTALASISRAKSLSTTRTELLNNITRYQESMTWERPPFLRPRYMSPRERLQEVDTALRGMETALRTIHSFPVTILDEKLQNDLKRLEDHVSLTIKNAKHNSNGGSLTVPEPETTTKTTTMFLQSHHVIPSTLQDLPISFFLFCAKLLHKKPLAEPPTSIQEPLDQKNGNPSESKGKESEWALSFKSPNLIPAFKCSLSLGLAVFLGSVYSKENGIWSGLPVAISYVSTRQPTFAVANIKAQGTVLGNVYGVLGCFVFERLLPMRFLSLLPWFIFTSFLQRSRMYGKSGGISAVIGAILILGRKNFGPPSEFAVVRIIETFIGLSCSIMVDLIFEPKRASSCAKSELTQCLATLHEAIRSLSLVGETSLQDNQKKLKRHVNELRKFVAEADVEPNFWFLPFHSACYNKLLKSLSELTDLLHLGAHALKILEQEFQRNEAGLKEAVTMLERDIGNVKEILCSSIKCFEEISRIKSLRFLEKELEKNNIISYDLELGKSPKSNICLVSGLSEDDVEKTVGSFLEQSRNAVDIICGGEDECEVKSEVFLSLNALGFCLSAYMRETMEIEKAIKELVQWENPSCEINLYDISCKLHALHKYKLQI
ncbi:fusaric acid resistance-like protein [Senna tora]|uniref:Fusaric acid resistance-like protein n=1 Tax=Senna tora TaxID=362788 RepID=A0A834SKK4_9FABA|nr:fusaric acid resistance-like protein [Senna tora]